MKSWYDYNVVHVKLIIINGCVLPWCTWSEDRWDRGMAAIWQSNQSDLAAHNGAPAEQGPAHEAQGSSTAFPGMLVTVGRSPRWVATRLYNIQHINTCSF